jgi:hypothetical protein
MGIDGLGSGGPSGVVYAEVQIPFSQPTSVLLSSLKSRSWRPHEVDMQSVAKARSCLDRGDGLTKIDC